MGLVFPMTSGPLGRGQLIPELREEQGRETQDRCVDKILLGEGLTQADVEGYHAWWGGGSRAGPLPLMGRGLQ